MMKTNELIAEISDLPAAKRAEIADYILRTLNRPDPEIGQAWMEEVQRRKKQVETGEVELIPGRQVIKELKTITEE